MKIPNEVMCEVMQILKRGNSVELKREKDNMVIVELKRKAKHKIPINNNED